MIDYKGKEFNLDNLLNFQLLKEILTELCKSQCDLKKEVDDLTENMKNKDLKIRELETKLSEITSQNEKKLKEFEEAIKHSPTYLNEANDINDNEEEVKSNGTAVKEDELNEEKEKIDHEKGNEVKENEKENELRQLDDIIAQSENNNTNTINTNTDQNQISPQTLLILSKKIRDNQLKIAALEKKAKTLTSITSLTKLEMDIKKKLAMLENTAKSNYDELNQNDLEFNEKYDQLKAIVDELQVKVVDFSIMDLFKDNGNENENGNENGGNIDITKALILTLETKVFKKFSLVDERNKIMNNDILKNKTNITNNKSLIEGLTSSLNNHKDYYESFKTNQETLNESFTQLKEKLQKKIDDLHSLYKKKFEDMKNNIDNQKAELNELIDKKLEDLPLQQQTIEKPLEKQENTSVIDDSKFKSLQKKINDLENKMRQYLTSLPFDDIKNKIKDLQFELGSKLSQNDLKELYSFYLMLKEGASQLKDNISIIYDNNMKTQSDVGMLSQKLESFSANLKALQNASHDNGKVQQSFDLTKYIDQAKFMESSKALYKEIERLGREDDGLHRRIEEILLRLENCPTNDKFNSLETTLMGMITDLKTLSNKKYADKIETNKLIKVIDLQIKNIINDNDKKDQFGENWLLAKKPLYGYKCASCEANLGNLNTQQEYLPWNKYPVRDEKAYRMGSGFSHMLQMMSGEIVKSSENKDVSIDGDEGKIRQHSGLVNYNSNVKTGKILLPKVQINKKSLELGDEHLKYPSDGEGVTDEVEKAWKNINSTSPRILKITKKKKESAGVQELTIENEK